MPRVPQLLNYIVYPTLLAAVFVIAVVGYALLCNPQQLPPSGSLLHARIQNPPHVRGGEMRGNGVGLCLTYAPPGFLALSAGVHGVHHCCQAPVPAPDVLHVQQLVLSVPGV